MLVHIRLMQSNKHALLNQQQNIDILKRISRLEKEVFGKQITE